MKSIKGIIPDLMLEKYLLKELSINECNEIEKILKTNVKEQLRFEELKKSNDEILERFPSRKMSSEIKKRYERELESSGTKFIREKKFKFTHALGALAFLIILIFPIKMYISDKSDIEITREKGLNPHILVYRKKSGNVELLRKDSVAKEGDLIQISYIAANHKYGTILSVDGNKNITLHFPADTNDDQKLEQKKEAFLKHSYELDNAPKIEKFYFFSSNKKLNIKDIKKSIQDLIKNSNNISNIKIKLSPDIKTSTFTLKKKGATK